MQKETVPNSHNPRQDVSKIRKRLIAAKDKGFEIFNDTVAFPRDARIIKEIVAKHRTNEDTRPSRVVDIGSGTGGLGKALHDIGVNVVSTDIENWHHHNGTVPFVRATADRLPFGTDTFDVSTLWFVLHHTDDPVKVLKEAARVSDLVIVQEDTVRTDGPKWWRQLQQITYERHVENFQIINTNSRSTPTSYTNDDWLTSFEKAGLEVVEAKQVHKPGNPVRKIQYVLKESETIFK